MNAKRVSAAIVGCLVGLNVLATNSETEPVSRRLEEHRSRMRQERNR